MVTVLYNKNSSFVITNFYFCLIFILHSVVLNTCLIISAQSYKLLPEHLAPTLVTALGTPIAGHRAHKFMMSLTFSGAVVGGSHLQT